jgi:CubicO group peptidase (beta-lactamase class C family)
VWDPPDGSWSRPPAFEDGAAGLVSPVDDLLAFARMFLRGGAPVLSRASVTEMTRDQLTPAQRAGQETFLGERSWGLCQSVVVSGDRAGAFGWDGGLGSSFLVDPVRDLIVIVLTQRLWESAQAPAVHTELQAAAYAALR